MQAIVIEEVGPFVNPGTDAVAYRHCDLCEYSGTNTIYAAVAEGERTGVRRACDESEWRRFYLVDGLSVCEDCLDEALKQ